MEIHDIVTFNNETDNLLGTRVICSLVNEGSKNRVTLFHIHRLDCHKKPFQRCEVSAMTAMRCEPPLELKTMVGQEQGKGSGRISSTTTSRLIG